MALGDSESAVILRLRGPLDLKCHLDSTDAVLMQKAISRTFEVLRLEVKSESCVLAVSDSPVLIWPNKGVFEEITPDTPCEDIFQWIQTDDQETSGKRSSKKKSRKVLSVSVINLSLIMDVTKPGPLSAPILTRTVQKSHFLRATLPMDCAVCCGLRDNIKDGCRRLLEALTRQLFEMENVTLQHMRGATLHVPEPLHFLLPDPDGLVTVVFPRGVPDKELESQRRHAIRSFTQPKEFGATWSPLREVFIHLLSAYVHLMGVNEGPKALPLNKELHEKFQLPHDGPYFRRANAYHFPNEPYKDGYLRNPHAVLTHPTLHNGKVYLVQGIYSYHHYMQDRMDDNGWGCAYRSLQTICSWFQQQGYVERCVPGHKDIQQALVDVGDKQASFVGSRQWIGSIEVQVVLDHLLGVTSKIMFVSQGSELATKGRELANHFMTEGTPVMIGGGVLAHTILGVAWSETTGEIRYLILDPHYTGAEDLQVITEKGWCGWKGPDFWDQTAYYNLCLPQRPRVI